MMLGFTSQPATSIRQVQHVMNTVKITDDKISQLRKDITANKVPNQGLTMRYVQQLEQQNSARKAWLVKNRETIKVLGVHASKTLTPPRDSFITPDGPRAYGNKSAPVISINDLQKRKPVRLQKPQKPTIDTPKNIPPKTIPPGADLKKQQDQMRLRQIEAQKRRVALLKKKADVERQKKFMEEGRLKKAQMVGRNRVKEDLRKAQEGSAPGSNTAKAVAKNAEKAVKRAQEKAYQRARMRKVQPAPKPLPAPKPAVVRDTRKIQQEQKIRTGSKMTIYKGVEFSLTEPNETFIKRVYRQLLLRDPGESGLKYWLPILKRRPNRYQYIDAIMQSQEYKRKKNRRQSNVQDQQRKNEAHQLAQYRPAALTSFLKEVESLHNAGQLSEQASKEGEARYRQMEEEMSKVHTQYLQGTIRQDLLAAKKMIDDIATKAIKDLTIIIQKYNVPTRPKVNPNLMSGPPRNITIPVHRQMTLNGMDKRSLAPIRTEQERGAQMGDNLGALFPALRRSMQGVLKQ